MTPLLKKVLLAASTLFLSVSLFASLRITEICPCPDALDPNGQESGWIELINTSDSETINLSDYALIRWNRGKEDKKKNRRILASRELGPGERTLIYTSEAYPNYWDGEKVTIYGPDNDPNNEGYTQEVMVFPSKVNPKKFPNVALYRADQKTLIETFIVPVDLPDDQSFGPGEGYKRTAVFGNASQYAYQLDDGEVLTGAGRLTVSKAQLPTDVSGAVTEATVTVVETVTETTNVLDNAGVLQPTAYDFSAVTAMKQGVQIKPTAYPEGCYSVSMWFRSNPTTEAVTSDTTGRGMPLFECRPSKTGNRTGINVFLNDEGQITVQPRNTSDSAQFLSNTTANYADNQWHHLVLVAGQQAKDTLSLYIDGEAVLTAEMPFDCALQNSIPFCFGHAFDSTSWHIFKGQLADIRLFYYDLSATEVAYLSQENAAMREVTGTLTGTAVSALEGAVEGYVFTNEVAANAMYLSTGVADTLCTGGETLDFWMKPTAFTATSGKEAITLMDSRNGSQDNNGYLLLIGTNEDSYKHKIYVQRGGGTKVNYAFESQSQLTTGEWVHVTFSIDAITKEATLYINGVKVDSQTVENYTTATVARRFGGSYDNYWQGFRGEMAEVKVFSGVLPAREMAKLHNASSLATSKVTEEGADETADIFHSVESLPTVTGEAVIELPTYGEGAKLAVTTPEVVGNLALTWNGVTVNAGEAITLDGETNGSLTWELSAATEADERLSIALEATLIAPVLGATRAIMPTLTQGAENNYTDAIAYGPNIGPSNAEMFEDFGYYLPEPMATPGEDYTVVLDVHPMVDDEQNAIAKVELMYRTGFGEPKYVNAELTDAVFQRTVEEEDENGDTIEVDKMFSGYVGVIPAADIPTNGQLIQFGARITDGAGREWISPSRNNPDDCPLWYGTIVEPTEDQKSATLQTFHLFVEDRYLAGGAGPSMDQDYDAVAGAYPLGARVGIYDGQTDTYYDNVRIDLRGNTSAHFPKKSHGLRFSKCQPLTCKNMLEGKKGTKLKEIRKSSFTAEYADPTFIRQSLSFHMWRNAGNKVPFHYPVRLQLNGEFYQLAFHSNRFTDELIEDYYGLDPMGYGYKNVGTISTSVGTSAGSVEKKTPDDGDETSAAAYAPMVAWAKTFAQSQTVAEAEIAAEATGTEVSEEIATQREALIDTVYDTFDIPAWINYLAMARITQEADDIWANICLYWDKNGNDVWIPLAYDHNLSFGAWYYGDDSAQGRIGLRPDSDNFKSHPFYSGWKVRAHKADGTIVGDGNYAVEALWQNPEIRQMYLRRLRTLMDEHLKAPGTAQTDTPFWTNYVEPFKAATVVDAELDRAKWGDSYTGTVIYVWDHKLGWDEAFSDLWDNYVEPRRKHLYNTHAITNTTWEVGYASNKNAGIPEAHPETFAPIVMEKVNGGVKLTNPNNTSIDLSGWTVEGLMDVSTLPEDSEDVVTLPPGTVLLGGKSLVLAYDRKAYIANNEPCFVIGLAVYGDDKTWIPEPNTETTAIILKKADGDVTIDNVLSTEIIAWLEEAIKTGKVTATALTEVTAAADYELAYLLDETPLQRMEDLIELNINAFAIDASGNITLTATITIGDTVKTGTINGCITLLAKDTLDTETWTTVSDTTVNQTFADDGKMTLTPVTQTMPHFFKVRLEKIAN